MNQRPKIGDRVEHFKGNHYEVLAIEVAHKNYREATWDYDLVITTPVLLSNDISQGQEYVLYKPLANHRPYLCMRSLGSFMGSIERDRFKASTRSSGRPSSDRPSIPAPKNLNT